jgi:hypothetical protein
MASATELRDDEHVDVQGLAESALCRRLQSLGPEVDAICRAEHARDNVVVTVDDAALAAALSDLRAGSGHELTADRGQRPKFHSAHSSSALAVSTFGPWRLEPRTLALDGKSLFTSLRFEAQRPIFTGRATPPNLDVWIEGADGMVAIESKLTEYLAGAETASFANRYAEAVSDSGEPSWSAMYSLLKSEPRHFRFLNADQLVKHYLGIKRATGDRTVATTLIYAYWEPADASDHDAFAKHRAEVAEFEASVADPAVRFRSLSYRDLWRTWASEPPLHQHADALRARYDVRLTS